MRGPKGVVDIDVGERREGAGELFIVRLFFGMKPQVLQEDHVTVAHLRDGASYLRADAVGQLADRRAQQFTQPYCHGIQRSEERRVGKSVLPCVDLGGRRIIKKKKAILEAKKRSISNIDDPEELSYIV